VTLRAGIELGGTKCIAIIAEDDRILIERSWPTTTPQETLPAIADALEGWRAEHPFGAIGIGSFGPLDLDHASPTWGFITTTPKPHWGNTDLAGYFARRLGVPVGIDTDVAGAALAEERWGAAGGAAVHVYITIGTGVGGALVVDGRPVHGTIHPEMGHVRMRRVAGDGFAGVCPFHGDCLEGLVSGPALSARAGKPSSEIGDDDPLWANVAADLAEATTTLIFTLSPQRIIFGGGVIDRRPFLMDLLRAGVAERLGGYLLGDTPPLDEIIRRAESKAGPLGATLLSPLPPAGGG
jgi:fructokinase